MAKTIGEELKALIPDGTQQKNLAIEWVEAWRRRDPKSGGRSTEGAESRLSQCLRSLEPGVKFFFGDDARFETTCEVFKVPAEARERTRQLANDVLSRDQQPRLVLDITSFAENGPEVDTMFDAIASRFLRLDALFPTLLVLTIRQYDKLPRSFDDLNGKLRVQKAADQAAARELVAGFSDKGAVLATPYPSQPFERWMAIRWGRAILECEPSIAAFTEHGCLPPLAAVTMPLDRICEEEQETPLPTNDPLRFRALMLKLAAGERLIASEWGRDRWPRSDVEPAVRLSWARQLGITASATKEEWLSGLPVRVAPVPVLRDKKWLDLARWVARCSGAPAIFVLGDQTIAINPSEAVRAEVTSLGNLVVEEPPLVGPGVLKDFIDKAVALTDAQRAQDPYLQGLAESFAQDNTDTAGLELIRQSLVASETLAPGARVAEKAATDCRSAMIALLDGVEPEARLLVRMERDAGDVRFSVSGDAPPWSVAAGKEVIVARGDDPLAWVGGYRRESALEVLKIEGGAESWTDGLLAAARIEGDGPAGLRRIDQYQWTPKAIGLSSERWDEADRELALLLNALRAAMHVRSAHQLPGNKVLMPLTNGILAEIQIYKQTVVRDEPHIGCLLQLAARDNHDFKLLPLTALHPTHEAETAGYRTQIGVMLPRGLCLRGRGYRADIVLRTSPLLPHAQPMAVVAGAAAAAAIVDAEERRKRD